VPSKKADLLTPNFMKVQVELALGVKVDRSGKE
jgi:hypothetical protein